MSSRGMPDRDEEVRPVLPWRIVAGAFLHFVVPVYLIAIVADGVLAAPHVTGAGQALERALRITPAVLGGYAALALLATLAAALLDPLLRRRRARREARDPAATARRSERRLRHTIADARGRFGTGADATLARLAAARWDHDDPRQQALARDLAESVAASSAALASSDPERRDLIATMAAQAIGRIADAQSELSRASAAQDEGRARAAAHYVEMRYGPSDFSSRAD